MLTEIDEQKQSASCSNARTHCCVCSMTTLPRDRAAVMTAGHSRERRCCQARDRRPRRCRKKTQAVFCVGHGRFHSGNELLSSPGHRSGTNITSSPNGKEPRRKSPDGTAIAVSLSCHESYSTQRNSCQWPPRRRSPIANAFPTERWPGHGQALFEGSGHCSIATCKDANSSSGTR